MVEIFNISCLIFSIHFIAGDYLAAPGELIPNSIVINLTCHRNYWWLGNTHCHSTYSDGLHSVSWDLNEVNNLGGSFLAITDHNTLAQCNDTGWHQTGNVLPIRGTEWTSDSGHACILGLQGDNPVNYYCPIIDMIDKATYRGGIVVINHPARPGVNWQHYPYLDIGIDAIEILNKSWSTYNQQAIDWWQSLLAQGRAIAGIASSDFHNDEIQNILDPCIRVYAPSNEPDTIIKYIKLGRMTMSEHFDHPIVYFYADSGNDGVYDKLTGDIISINTPTIIKFRIESHNNLSGYKAWFFDKNGIFEEHPALPGSWVYEWTHTYTPDDTNFVRVEIRNAENEGQGFTNPIYINYRPYEMGPIDLSIQTTILPESLLSDEIDTIYLRLTNNGPLTPYNYGVHFSVDTSQLEIVDYKTSGYGIGYSQSGPNWDGFQWVEWYGGNHWDNYLPPNDTVNYWVALRPRTTGEFLIYYRAWAGDRIFVVNRSPQENQGMTGAGGFWCWTDTIIGLIDISEQQSKIKKKISLYIPTHTRHALTLSIFGDKLKEFEITIYNILGKAVKSEKITPNFYKISIPLVDSYNRTLPEGIYFAVVKTERWKTVRKFIVLK
ncbi:MAG: CehA/McbA family metallohydrolase [candidate division WOR-3 bacterium]